MARADAKNAATRIPAPATRRMTMPRFFPLTSVIPAVATARFITPNTTEVRDNLANAGVGGATTDRGAEGADMKRAIVVAAQAIVMVRPRVLAEKGHTNPAPAVRHHREDSGLSNQAKRSLPPFFANPDVVLDYCPQEKEELMKRILDHMALRRAQIQARNGYKADAIDLLKRFPGTKSFKWRYYRCRTVMALSRWYPYWVRFKCALGPPTRLFLKRIGAKLKLLPPIPEVNSPENPR